MQAGSSSTTSRRSLLGQLAAGTAAGAAVLNYAAEAAVLDPHPFWKERVDGLLREIELDRANGLLGKTCIHPAHTAPVHALSVVSHEEYSDAGDILRPERGGGGVMRSAYTNKMNEVKPHRAWAERTMLRAEVFGVANEDVGFVELLAAGIPG